MQAPCQSGRVPPSAGRWGVPEAEVMLGLAGILILGIGGQWLAHRLRIPSILVLLALGLLVGPAARAGLGVRLIDPDRLFGELLLPLTSLAVGVILYEGGLGLRLAELREVGRSVGRLLSVGALVTWLLTAAISWAIGLYGPGLSLLLGAVLVVTGPTVIGPLLRHVRPSGRAEPLLRWEGIAIDPLGATLALLVFEAMLTPDFTASFEHVLLGAARTILAGGILGGLAGGVLVVSYRRHWLPDHLENPASLMLLVAAFTGADLVQEEAGLLAATVMGAVVGNLLEEEAQPIVEFKESLQVMLIAGLFVVLAARLELGDLLRAIGWRSLLLCGALIVVVRPVAVFLATLRTPLEWRERAFVAAVAPRGIVAAAVASVFALRLEEVGWSEAGSLAPICFVAIVATVSVYGLTAGYVARALGLAEADPQGLLLLGAHRLGRSLARALVEQGLTVRLIDANRDNVRAARMDGLETVHANVLSRYAAEELDLSSIGRFLALTPNDEVNTLAAERFAEDLGRRNVLKLASGGAGRHRYDPAHGFRVRVLFDEEFGYAELMRRLDAGQRVKATRLSEEYPFSAWRERYPAGLPLLILRGGKVRLFAVDLAPDPQAGDVLIALVPEDEETSEERRRLRGREAASEALRDAHDEAAADVAGPDAAAREAAEGGEDDAGA